MSIAFEPYEPGERACVAGRPGREEEGRDSRSHDELDAGAEGLADGARDRIKPAGLEGGSAPSSRALVALLARTKRDEDARLEHDGRERRVAVGARRLEDVLEEAGRVHLRPVREVEDLEDSVAAHGDRERQSQSPRHEGRRTRGRSSAPPKVERAARRDAREHEGRLDHVALLHAERDAAEEEDGRDGDADEGRREAVGHGAVALRARGRRDGQCASARRDRAARERRKVDAPPTGSRR